MIAAGQQIGGYTVLHLLGRGGMGEVYLAQHRRVARRAAIKVLVPELSQNAVVLDRFFNEARAASLIRHPGIVDILDCDLYQGQAYIVMEYLDGESFGGYLFRTGPLERDIPFLLGVSAAVASAVGAAHATGIIHRDLKPDNVYLHLGPNEAAGVAVKILDFGIAKLALQDGGPSQTSTGVLLGTPAYMSPEQCRGAGRVDSRSDIYSLGCILYEAACGFPPFVREGMGDLIVAHVSEAPVPPIQHAPSLPPSLNALILRMLAKSFDDRPQTMDDVVAALRDCAKEAGVAIDGPLRPRIPVERPAATVEGAATQPPGAGPSAVETARLGPRSPVPFPQEGVPSGAIPALSSRSGGISAGRSGANYAGLSGPTADQSAGGEDPRADLRNDQRNDHRMNAPKSTTLSSTAAEMAAVRGRSPSRNGRTIAVVAGVAVAVGLAIVGVRSRSTPGPVATARPSPPAVSAVTAPAVPPAPTPAAAHPAEAPPAAPQPDVVHIDFQGIPAGTTAQVDGKRASLPIELDRGSELHHIVLRPPGESSRTIELDGSRDRIVDFVATTRAPGGRDHAGERDAAHRAPVAAPARGARPKTDKGPAVNPTDREAITDI